MKAFRRSLKGVDREKYHNHHHSSSSSSFSKPSVSPKSAIAILPPKKVIKALYDYEPAPGSIDQLSFTKGDFFHVISRENASDWYEACNPLIPSCRGLVPVSFFEPIGRNVRESGDSYVDLSSPPGSSQSQSQPHIQNHTLSNKSSHKSSHDSGYSDSSSNTTNTTKHAAQSRMSNLGKSSGATVYGVVQYDFQAERPDELDSKAGEFIIVIAQSNPEWFVAKPISRLGGPGLIPVSFIEVKDTQTGLAVVDPLDAVRRAGVPRVEEWKKMTADYKNSSITLGKIDSSAPPSAANVQSITSGVDNMSMHSRQSAGTMAAQGHLSNSSNNGNGFYHQRNTSRGTISQPQPQSQQQPQPQPEPDQHMPAPLSPQNGYPPLAPVEAYIPRYCFENGKYWYIVEAKMEDGRCWELSRSYEDFYDCQIELLNQFDEEAGKRGKPRILPYMPGPVANVTESIAYGRHGSLDEYVKKLLVLPPHITRCQLVRKLFAPRQGDFEIDADAFGEDIRYSAGSHQSVSSASRSSSQVHVNSPPVDRQSYQRTPSLPHANGGLPPRTDLQAPVINRQPSSITSLTPVSTVSSGGVMKVKVFFQDDLIAIRVPNDIGFQQLKDKLADRLKVKDELFVQYRDEHSGAYFDLANDRDLDIAMQRNSKLTLHVGLV